MADPANVSYLLAQLLAQGMPAVVNPDPWDVAAQEPPDLDLGKLLEMVAERRSRRGLPTIPSGRSQMTPRERQQARKEWLSREPDPMFRPYDITMPDFRPNAYTPDYAPNIYAGQVAHTEEGVPFWQYPATADLSYEGRYFPADLGYMQYPGSESYQSKHDFPRPRSVRRFLPPDPLSTSPLFKS